MNMPAMPTPTTRARRLKAGCRKRERRVRFLVEDEGYGIPPEEANRVFEKFYRSGNRETRAESGFGLGLAFVREVALKHGGDVTLESRPGAGSSLTLWILASQGQRL